PGLFMLVAILGFGWSISHVIRRGKLRRYENLALIEELSRQKTMAEEARRAAESARTQAEAANRSKTQFFAAASHDLRQPLHAMGLFAAALAEKVRDPEVVDVVNSINASVDALETLFNELLDISKIDAGIVKASPSDFAVQSVFDRLRMDLEPEAFEKELRLRFVPSRAFARSDPILVERILRNLVSNAIRYTRRGGIVVGCRRRRGALSLEVWDTGIGIPPEQQARIFDEFYQVANPERDRKKGLGLGLAIVQRLSGLLGSTVTVASRPGHGSVFRVAVPVGVTPKRADEGAKAVRAAATDLSGSTIVVIEDEGQVLEGMRVLLSGWGAAVIPCATLEEAFDAIAPTDRPPDLIIADYRLREGATGVEAIDALRARFHRDIPAVVITGSTMPVHMDEAKSKGFHLLLKPVMPAKLRTLIHFKLRQAA
ncbi:MAG TPA: hybrid sensor histidine kinase/response regulator, partial [Burkholderiales bacterium]|nr:hybrid sensor histidine kinase/response regulator [Burkholderiales bacterium]